MHLLPPSSTQRPGYVNAVFQISSCCFSLPLSKTRSGAAHRSENSIRLNMDGTDHPQAGFPEQTTIPTGASQRPTVSPYKEVQVLQLGWQNDIEAGRRNFKAIEAAWKEYDYVITTVFCKPFCEPQARKDENEKDIKTSRNDGSASMTRTKRICLTCPGVRGRSYSLLLASGMELSVMMRLSLASTLHTILVPTLLTPLANLLA